MPDPVTIQLAPVEVDVLRYTLLMDLATAGENLGALCAETDLEDPAPFTEMRAKLEALERRVRDLDWGSTDPGVCEVVIDPDELRARAQEALQSYAEDIRSAVREQDDAARATALDRIDAARSLIDLADNPREPVEA